MNYFESMKFFLTTFKPWFPHYFLATYQCNLAEMMFLLA